MAKTRKEISVVFYQNDRGKMPVRDWILGLSAQDRRTLGEDIKTVEFGWPIGMPVAKPLGRGLYEVRSTLSGKIEGRVFFMIHKNLMVLLHAFEKKTRATPQNEIKTARRRMKKISS